MAVAVTSTQPDITASHPTSVLVVTGPTGSGKSALAIDAAEAFHGTVINADSMQVYRELRVLSARPSPADEARVPHRLFGILPASEPCSAGRWLALAVDEIRSAWRAGRVPIVTGGTGLYLRALFEGLAPVPPIPASIRSEASTRLAKLGPQRFRQELAELDADAASRLPDGDSQRLIRAYEVVRATGRPWSAWLRDRPARPLAAARFATIVLLPPTEILYAALDARLDHMLNHGAIDEVRHLAELAVGADLPAMKAVGVRELAAHLRGEFTLEDAVVLAKRATRRFAKRQKTWFRHQLDADESVFEQYSETAKQKIFPFIRRFLLTPGS